MCIRDRGKAGCFAAPRFTQFHRELAHEWIPQGRAVLARLCLAGQVHVVLYGFVGRDKFYFYQSGVRKAGNGPFISPGTTANLMLMQALSAKGVVEYDFLRGASAYKQRLASEERELLGLQIVRYTFRSAFSQCVQIIQKVIRRTKRLFDFR